MKSLDFGIREVRTDSVEYDAPREGCDLCMHCQMLRMMKTSGAEAKRNEESWSSDEGLMSNSNPSVFPNPK